MPAQTFTVDVPGIQDIIRIPAIEDDALRAQRIQRMRTANSPIPEPLAWIPGVINWLDDAQDLLFTVLVTGRILFKRLLLRAIPVIGWVLFANDLLNLATSVLGFALGGRASKKASADLFNVLAMRKARRLQRAGTFLQQIPWFGFIIQAAQVARDWTGYGLQLGGVMGMMTDWYWGKIRLLTDPSASITIRQPPPADIISKAGRVLVQSLSTPWLTNELSPEDHRLLMLSQVAAMHVLFDTMPVLPSRSSDSAQNRAPNFFPWNPASIAALESSGWAIHSQSPGPNHDPDNGFYLDDFPSTLQPGFAPGAVATGFRNPITAITQGAPAQFPNYFGHQRALWIETTEGSALGFYVQDATLRLFDWAGEIPDNLKPIFEDRERDILRAIEFNVFPPANATSSEIEQWLDLAGSASRSQGFDSASAENLKAAARIQWNGHDRRAFAQGGQVEIPS